MKYTIIAYAAMVFLCDASTSELSSHVKLLVLQQAEDNIESAMSGETSQNPLIRNSFLAPLGYLHQLRTNWTNTIVMSPHTFFNAEALAETFQFYFTVRTNFEEETVATLLRPPAPLNLNKTSYSDKEWRELKITENRIIVSWFHLFTSLGPESVLKSDPSSMLTLVRMKAYLDRMCRSGLNELLDGNDYAAIVEAINAVPHLSDEYLAKLAEDHNKVSVGKDYFAHFSNRFLEYQNISKQLSVSIEYWYYSTWQVNPNVLNNSMLALEAWINNDLEHVASIIDAADKNIDGKSTLAKHGLNFANQALMEIANANIPPTNHLQANVIPKLTEQNLDLVRELNKYLRYRGQSFDVDYVSKSNADLSALQAGDWKKAAAGIQPDDVSVNLTLPIAILADYAKRSPNDAFKADLELIFARLEGLRDRASKIVNQ